MSRLRHVLIVTAFFLALVSRRPASAPRLRLFISILWLRPGSVLGGATSGCCRYAAEIGSG